MNMTRRTALSLIGATGGPAFARIVQGRKTAKEQWTDYPTRTLDEIKGFQRKSVKPGAFGGDSRASANSPAIKS